MGVDGSDLWDERVWGRDMGSQERGCEGMPFRPVLRSSPTSGALGSGVPVSGEYAVQEGPGRGRESGPSGPPGIRNLMTETAHGQKSEVRAHPASSGPAPPEVGGDSGCALLSHCDSTCPLRPAAAWPRPLSFHLPH